MLVVYGGPFEAVEIPHLGLVATRGVPVEVPDDSDLTEQACFTAVPRPTRAPVKGVSD
jgi:hypothetical protein